MSARRNPKADDPLRTPYVTIFVHGDDYDRALATLAWLEPKISKEALRNFERVLLPAKGVDEYGYQPNVQRSYPLIHR